jgi:hypothetical protein
LCWFAVCNAGVPPGSNTQPLVFGMSAQAAADALGVPLVRVPGRRSEVYAATRPAGVPGIYPVDETMFLQFRRGRLTGWKSDWRMRPRWF